MASGPVQNSRPGMESVSNPVATSTPTSPVPTPTTARPNLGTDPEPGDSYTPPTSLLSSPPTLSSPGSGRGTGNLNSNGTTSIQTLLGYMQRRLSDFVGSSGTAITLRAEGASGARASEWAVEDDHEDGGGAERVQQQRLPLHPMSESTSLHRAGLLQPRSYNAPSPMTPSRPHPHPHPHSFIQSVDHAPSVHHHNSQNRLHNLNLTPITSSSSHQSIHTLSLPRSNTPHNHQPSAFHPLPPSTGDFEQATGHQHLYPHHSDSIRAATLELSNMPFPASVPLGSGVSLGGVSVLLGSSPAKTQQATSTTFGARPDQHKQQEPHGGTGGFIFPSSPIMTPPAELAASGSSTTLPVNFGFEPEEEEGKSLRSSSLLSSAMTDGDETGMEGSVGTLLSFAPSSLVVPDETRSEEERDDEPELVKETHNVKDKRKKTNPSGLSLLRPTSGSGSSGSDASSSSSRSSSADSDRQEGRSTGPSVTPPPPPVPHLPDTTPTASPFGTPRPIPKPLESDEELEQHHGRILSPHVRWRGPASLVRAISHSRSRSRDAWAGHRIDESRFGDGGDGDREGLLDESTPLLFSRHGRDTSYGGGDEEGGWNPKSFLSNLGARVGGVAGFGGFGGPGGMNGDASHPSSVDGSQHPSKSSSWRTRMDLTKADVKARVRKEVELAPEYGRMAVKAVPAVLLGCLLNILDGVSYGMIVFPATGVFADLGPMGVSMFFLSTVVAQLVYTLGGSGFGGANGSMMIEVVPFFHILATSIANEIGEDDPASVIATTLAAYAFSSILTGLSFFLLGALRLGVVVGFFPRHILVGCIGGVGAFLIETGLTVSMRISDDDFDYSLETLKLMFLDTHNLVLWSLPLFLAILLRVITHKYNHQLIFPLYFTVIPLLFYIIVAAARLNLTDLRHAGWIFDMGAAAHEPWYKFYSYFDFGKVSYSVLWSTLPTQFALLFFNILHPPLNVPALAVSLNDDVDTNKELVGHGYSNLLSGLFGTVPNYLVYVNTLLFYRVGGNNRIAGFLLAMATAALLVIGPGPIAFIPVMVVGALIFVLGIDLVKEALWDNRHRVTKSEYVTIVSIMICMTVWDFVIGVLFGIIVSCFFFVVQNSRLKSIRAMYTGDLAMSAVRRPSLQRAYIREVSKQTTILRLQGFLFFGTITHVEETIRSLIEGPYWTHHPVQFLVLDLSLVAGVDMSSAEAFVRIQRLLTARCVTLVFCGFEIDSAVGKALRSVDVLGAPGVELFSNFNDAMEWTENAYLRAWFRSQKIETSATSMTVPGRRDADIVYNHLVGSFVRSPRRSHLRDAGDRTIAADIFTTSQSDLFGEPFNTLAKAFSSYATLDPVLFQPIVDYLERTTAVSDTVLWRQDDAPDGLYIIEAGVLRATYRFANPEQSFEESMVAGTVAGELSALSDAPRNCTMVVEHPSVLWKMSTLNIKKLQMEEPELGRVFIQLVLKAAKLDYDILLAAIASRQ